MGAEESWVEPQNQEKVILSWRCANLSQLGVRGPCRGGGEGGCEGHIFNFADFGDARKKLHLHLSFYF